MDLIQRIEDILINYYKDETTFIKSNINSMIENFEQYFLESLKNEKNMINKLSLQLDNRTIYIENIDDNITKKTINNLQNTINIINNIKMQIKDSINKEMDLKDNYFLPQSKF